MLTLLLICATMGISSLFAQSHEEPLHSLSMEKNKARVNQGEMEQRNPPLYSRRAIRHTHRGMIQALCKHGHIYSETVRHAMLRVDRKNYFSKPVTEPYRIKSRPIGFGSDMSSAHIHAQMLELLKDKIRPGARILDVGSGSGYLTACLAYLAGPTGRVYGVEHVMELAEASIKNIDKGNSELLDQGRVQFVVWNGKHGYDREAPYDIIHVAPSYYTIPQKLLDQLVPGGRMLMPIGEPFKGQNLTIIDKLADGYTIITTVVRTVRTNPMYRDRFQQKKYYSEMRRKAQERYNRSQNANFSSDISRKKTQVTYVFKSKDEEQQEQQEQEQQQQEQEQQQQQDHHGDDPEANDQGFDHSISGQQEPNWHDSQREAERTEKRKQESSNRLKQLSETSTRLSSSYDLPGPLIFTSTSKSPVHSSSFTQFPAFTSNPTSISEPTSISTSTSEPTSISTSTSEPTSISTSTSQYTSTCTSRISNFCESASIAADASSIYTSSLSTSTSSISESLSSSQSTFIDESTSVSTSANTPLKLFTMSDEGLNIGQSVVNAWVCKCNKTYKSQVWYKKHIATCKVY